MAIVGIGCWFPGNRSTPLALWDILRDPPDLLTCIPEDKFSINSFHHHNSQMRGHTNVKSLYFLEGKNAAREFNA